MKNLTTVLQKYIEKKSCPSSSGILSNWVLYINFVKSIDLLFLDNFSLREKCPYSEFFWSVFARIQTEHGEIPYLSIFNPNVGKYGPEKLQIWKLFTQCSKQPHFEQTYCDFLPQ